jgi:creatinine amidohydrolase
MQLADMTWREVEAADRSCVVLIPTGSLEQHGPALPLRTDSLIVTAVAEEVERRMPDRILLTPTLWLGSSDHHLKMPGTLSASFEVQIGALLDVVGCLVPHGFGKFYLLNGHGGNTAGNSLATRRLKAAHPNLTFGAMGYYDVVASKVAALMEGPQKELRHACEAETSLVMALRPDLVRRDKLRDDGLVPDPPVKFGVHSFDEVTEEGVLGYATYATPEKGKAILEAAVEGVLTELRAVAEGHVFRAQGR